MVTKVISELKSVSRLKILPETGPCIVIYPSIIASVPRSFWMIFKSYTPVSFRGRRV